MLKEVYQSCIEKEHKWGVALMEYILGKVYLQIVAGAGPVSLSIAAKNFGFLIKNVPFASKKAEAYFNRAIERSKKIGAKGTLGAAYLDLGKLFIAKKEFELAAGPISEAIQILGTCWAESV